MPAITSSVKREFSLWGAWTWFVEVALNIVAGAIIGGALKMPGLWKVGLFLGVAMLITAAVHGVVKLISRLNYPGTRDVSHLEVKHPIASRRDLAASEITEKTILIERVINKDNRIADKLFIRCSIVGPAVIFSDDTDRPKTDGCTWNVDDPHGATVCWQCVSGGPYGGVGIARSEFRDCMMWNIAVRVPTKLNVIKVEEVGGDA